MSIITIASTKGGVGKSTFVINLASIFINEDRKIAVLDADAQNTVSKWNRVREFMISEGAPLKQMFVASARGNTLLEIAQDKKHQGYTVLIDSPGVDDSNMRAALLRSDYIFTLCSPSPVELWEVDSLLKIINNLQKIQNRKIPLALIFNKIPPTHSDSSLSDAVKFFEENNILPDFILNSPIKERVVFKHSIRDGKGVIDYSPLDQKAKTEMYNCYNEIITIIDKNR
jgi:chromosome partitioning protein